MEQSVWNTNPSLLFQSNGMPARDVHKFVNPSGASWAGNHLIITINFTRPGARPDLRDVAAVFYVVSAGRGPPRRHHADPVAHPASEIDGNNQMVTRP